ncbi:MAG: hypothetical protein ACHREM_00550 [Polyangiales bacterium]
MVGDEGKSATERDLVISPEVLRGWLKAGDGVRAAKREAEAARARLQSDIDRMIAQMDASLGALFGARFRCVVRETPRNGVCVLIEVPEQTAHIYITQRHGIRSIEELHQRFVVALAGGEAQDFFEMWKDPACARCGHPRGPHNAVAVIGWDNACAQYEPMRAPLEDMHVLAGHIPGAVACCVGACRDRQSKDLSLPLAPRCEREGCKGVMHATRGVGLDSTDPPPAWDTRCDVCGTEVLCHHPSEIARTQ